MSAMALVLLLLLTLPCATICGAQDRQLATSCLSLTSRAALVQVVVSDTDGATLLGQELLRCPGFDFEVDWRGKIRIDQPLELANGTSLKITGSGNKDSSIVDGGGQSSLFFLNGSALLLDSVVLTGGDGIDGGVVEARDGASVEFNNCDVYLNKASSNGGE